MPQTNVLDAGPKACPKLADARQTIAERLLPVETGEKIVAIISLLWDHSWPEAGRTLKTAASYMRAIGREDFQVWRVKRDGQSVAMVITEILASPHYGVRCMEIKDLVSQGRLSLDDWKEGFEDILAMAKLNGCKAIQAATTNPRILEITAALGFGTEVTILRREI